MMNPQTRIPAEEIAEELQRRLLLPLNVTRAVMAHAAAEYAADLLASGNPPHTIQRRLCVYFGVARKTARAYFKHAQHIMRRRATFLSPDHAKAWIVGMLGAVISDPKTPGSARVQAIRTIAEVSDLMPKQGAAVNVNLGGSADAMTAIVNIVEGRDPLPVVGPETIDVMFQALPPPAAMATPDGSGESTAH